MGYFIMTYGIIACEVGVSIAAELNQMTLLGLVQIDSWDFTIRIRRVLGFIPP